MFESITALELFSLWQAAQQHQESCTIIDVREDNEYAAMHIASACHIPLQTIPNNMERIPKAQTVYFICQGGIRSAQAANWLAKEAGYTQLVNVEGGMTAWLQAGFPIEEGV